MEWKEAFRLGVLAFQASNLQASLSHFNKAIELDGNQFIVYDSRAAVYHRMGKAKEALQDAKRVISLAPDRWHGYARSARILLEARKQDAALVMIDFALARVGSGDTSRRHAELTRLKESVLQQRESNAPRVPGRTHNTLHFSQLPVEIIAEIFLTVVVDDPARVLVLASTCGRWRAIALNTAALWGTLVLSNESPAEKAKLWIGRSKGRIRELVVHEGVTNDFGWSFDHLNGMNWDVLRECTLGGHSFFPARLRPEPMARMLSSLESLHIRHALGKNEWNSFLGSFTDSPLKSLTVDFAGFDWAVLTTRFKELVSLVVRQVTPDRGDDILAVIEANPKLRKIALNFNQFITPASTRQESITLPFLAHLEIGGAISGSDILGNVNLPSIKTLYLFRSLSTDAAFTRLTPTCLTELRVQACGVTATILIPFLRSASSLEVLQLTRLSGVTNMVAEALAGPDRPKDVRDSSNAQTRPPLCPCLKHVDFSHCDDLKAGPLVRLVRSRRASTSAYTRLPAGTAETPPPVAQISSLLVNGCSQVDASAVPWLRSKVDVFSCLYMTKKEAKWR